MNTASKAAASAQHNGTETSSSQFEETAERHMPRSFLSDEMLARFESRAATYDRENRFFSDDFAELRAAKYLLLPVPVEFGGSGFRLAEVCREQRRLAYRAPATALAVNMHLYWLGVAADLWRQGHTSLEWILREAAARSEEHTSEL